LGVQGLPSGASWAVLVELRCLEDSWRFSWWNPGVLAPFMDDRANIFAPIQRAGVGDVTISIFGYNLRDVTISIFGYNLRDVIISISRYNLRDVTIPISRI
jgi:hypothetical protein